MSNPSAKKTKQKKQSAAEALPAVEATPADTGALEQETAPVVEAAPVDTGTLEQETAPAIEADVYAVTCPKCGTVLTTDNAVTEAIKAEEGFFEGRFECRECGNVHILLQVPDVPFEEETDLGENVLDPDPEIEATLKINQCPRCKHISGDRAVKLGPPNRVPCRGIFDGKEYNVVETRRIMCEKCRQIHFVKKYL